MKMLVEADSQKVLGLHMVGEDAGEIVQGLAVALTAGATKADFRPHHRHSSDLGGGVRYHEGIGAGRGARRLSSGRVDLLLARRGMARLAFDIDIAVGDGAGAVAGVIPDVFARAAI